MRRLLRLLVWSSLLLGALVGLLRVTALRWYRLPDDDPYLEASVAPALRGGDWLILWRLTPPTYGDLVLCPEPKEPGRVVIGRLLGEEGDTISVKGDAVTVNGKRLGEERPCLERDFEVENPNVGTVVEQHCQLEVAGSAMYMRGSVAGHKLHPLEVKQEVVESRVFLVSDNRLFPYDSRDYGQVERETCRETVVFRLVGKRGFFDVERRLTLIR